MKKTILVSVEREYCHQQNEAENLSVMVTVMAEAPTFELWLYRNNSTSLSVKKNSRSKK